MAKVEKTETQKRWERVLREYDATDADPENAGASMRQKCIAIGKKLKISDVTVRKIVERFRDA